ncbi:hypothetical protein LBMAG42_03990 [Deltaproteobacteria bacterium]|nr:hypothetical protein LBMAG42_03990 [Deltaproteobacteria bacterium]
MIRLHSAGRGGGYSRARGVSEAALGRLYRGGWAARLWARAPGATEVQAHHHRLAVLPTGAPPLRVGYASDLHIGPTTPPEVLARAADLLAAASLDVLLLGGDFVFLEATVNTAQLLRDWVRSVPATHKFAVLGNHDLWTHHARLEAALQQEGVQLLVNEASTVGDVAFLGLDDPWTGAPAPHAALAACGSAPTRVALVHSPDAVPLLQGKVDVYLCGHTHGGQLALPGGRPIVVPGPGGRKWPHGRFEVQGTTVLVSRGLGGVEVPVRTFAPPDVMIVDLVGR